MSKRKRRASSRMSENGFVQSMPRPFDANDETSDRPEGRTLPFLKMTQGAYQKTIVELGARPPEAAGILFGPKDEEPLATHFVLDTEGSATSVSFTLNADFLNAILHRYKLCDLACVGIAHSHPSGFDVPSHGDLEYLATMFRRPANNAAGLFLFPIFSGGKLRPYLISPTSQLPRVMPAVLVLV